MQRDMSDASTKPTAEAGDRREEIAVSRRDALRRVIAVGVAASSAGVLSACASSTRGRRVTAPPSDSRTDALLRKYGRSRVDARRSVHASAPPTLAPAEPTPFGGDAPPSGVVPRSRWAKGAPIPQNMNRMLPIRRITFHHDGMDIFRDTSEWTVASRLETIRRSHLNRSPPFGDIGYHYIIDPAGRVWQGRPLTWQGAHVGRQNEGNLGICILGNYERQQPNAAQERAIRSFLAGQMAAYRVTADRVHTHRELAATACPGRFLQPRLAAARSAASRLSI